MRSTQIAAIIDVPGRLPIELNYRVRPKEGVHMVSPEALEICGITMEQLKNIRRWKKRLKTS